MINVFLLIYVSFEVGDYLQQFIQHETYIFMFQDSI